MKKGKEIGDEKERRTKGEKTQVGPKSDRIEGVGKTDSDSETGSDQ